MTRLLFLMILIFHAAQAPASNVRRAVPGDSAPPAQIEDVMWLVGHWEGEGLGGRSYETISPPVAGQMAGHFQQVSDKGVEFYEFYHFVPHRGSLMLRIKHFGPNLAGWEERTQTVDFPLVAIEEDAVYFDGLTMRRDGQDTLRTYVLVGKPGEQREVSFKFRRMKN